MKKKRGKKILKRKIRKENIDNSFFGLYRQSWNYIKESKNYIYSVIGVFVAFALIGYFVPPTPEIQEMIMEFLRDLIEKTQNLNQGELTAYIFWNNLQSAFTGLFFGIVLGFFSVIATMINGYVVGYVSKLAVGVEGPSVLWQLVPHGIFELPAVLVSLGLGLKLGSFIFQEKKIESLKHFLWMSFLVFVLIVLPLLIIAAIIEGGLINFFR